MTRGKIVLAFLTTLGFPMLLAHGALTINFAAMPGSTIQFNGSASSFQFNPLSSGTPVVGNQWRITTVNGGTGTAVGLQGWFIGGPWSYGGITISGPLQTANVTTPTASFIINDGAGFNAVGNVNWATVSTYGTALGGVNAALTVNVTGMTYTGVNADLLALVAGGNGKVNLSFQFTPGRTLTQLTTGTGTYATSYSGTFTPVVPEASTILAGALLLLPFAASTLRIWRKAHPSK